MMTLVATVGALAVVAAFAVRARVGLQVFLLAVLVTPYITLPSAAVRIEQFLVPALLGLVVVKFRVPTIALPEAGWSYFAWWGWLLAATVLLRPGASEASLSWITVYTLLRPLGVVLLFASPVAYDIDILQVNRWFVAAAIPLGLLAVLQTMGHGLATALTVSAYTSPYRTPVVDLLAQLGIITRAVSVFESPPYAATYFLVAIGIGTWLLLARAESLTRRWHATLLWGVVMAILAGVATLSATFLAGCVLLIGLLLIALPPRGRRTLIIAGSIALIPIVAIVVRTMSNLDIAGGTLLYELERVRSLDLFASRYSASGGFIVDALAAIRERPLVGWGLATPATTFVGDSIYVVIVYYGGLIGALILCSLFLFTARRAFPDYDTRWIFILWAVLLLAAGAGGPSLFIPRLQEWWWAMIGLLNRPVAPTAPAPAPAIT